MKLKAFYSNESEIPTELKPYYVQEGDKWVLDGGEETVGPYYNAALDAKKKELKLEKDQEKSAKEAANREVSRLTEQNTKLQNDLTTAKTELASSKAPGMIAVSKAEKAELDEFKALGNPQEVKDKLSQLTKFEEVAPGKKPEELKTELVAKQQLEAKVAAHARDELLRQAAESTGWQFAVLKDLMTHPERSAGIEEIRLKDVTEGEGEAKKTTRRAFAVVKGQTEGEKLEKPLEQYATERTDWQPYLNALKPQKEDDNGGPPRITTADPAKKGQQPKSSIDEATNTFNTQRSTRKDPFARAGSAAAS